MKSIRSSMFVPAVRSIRRRGAGKLAPPPAPGPDLVFPAINPNAWLAAFSQEQSEGMGPSLGNATLSPVPPFYSAGNSVHYAKNLTTQARMLSGLKRSDGVSVSIINSPVGAGYDKTIPATGTQAMSLNTGVMAHFIFAELALRGVFSNRYFPQFHNAAGQQVLNLDDDPLTGQAGTILFENLQYHTQQLAARAAAAGKTVQMLFNLCIQGSSNNNDAPTVWTAGFDLVDEDQRRVVAQSGIASSLSDVPRLVYQTAAYTNTSLVDSWVCLEQLEVVRRGGAIFAGSMNQFKNADNQIHAGLAETARACTLGAWGVHATIMGERWNLLSARHEVIGNQTIVWYPVRPGETMRSINDKFDAYGGNPLHGYQVTGGASIVSQAPGAKVGHECSMVVTLDRPASGLGRLKLGRQKADVRGFADAAGSNYGAHRVGWATTETRESIIYPGLFAERVLPSEEWTI